MKRMNQKIYKKEDSTTKGKNILWKVGTKGTDDQREIRVTNTEES